MCIRPLPSSSSPLAYDQLREIATETHYIRCLATIISIISAVVGVITFIAYAATKNDISLIMLGVAIGCYVSACFLDPPAPPLTPLPTPMKAQHVFVAQHPPAQLSANPNMLQSLTVKIMPASATAGAPLTCTPTISLPPTPRPPIDVMAAEIPRSIAESPSPSPPNVADMPPPQAITPALRRKRLHTPTTNTNSSPNTRSRAKEKTPSSQLQKKATPNSSQLTPSQRA